jgi:hypothetical protein
MKQNLSSVYQIRDAGSGQILQPRQLNRSPGLAKIAPWCLAHRDNISAKAVGEETGWAYATNAYFSYPLAVSIQANRVNSVTNFLYRCPKY